MKKTDTAPANVLQEIAEALETQLAIRADQVGQLIGLTDRQTAQAINRGALGIQTFQIVPRGRHMAKSTDVRAFMKEHGLELPATAAQEAEARRKRLAAATDEDRLGVAYISRVTA